MRPQRLPEVPVVTKRVAKAVFARPTLPMRIRDELGELFSDEQFAAAFAVRGRPGLSPGQLAMVTVLQFAAGLSDRQAAEAVRARIDWKYCLGLELDDAGFDFSVLCEFRARLIEHGLAELVLDMLLEHPAGAQARQPGGKQRTDSTHVISAVRDLDRTELAGESVRACLEALAVAAPGWLAGALDVPDWAARYPARTVSWRLPKSQTQRDRLAAGYGVDGFALLNAVYAPDTPAWLADLPAVEVLRMVLVQNYVCTVDADGSHDVRHRQADPDGLPPGRTRLTSPYDLQVRWSKKERGAVIWNGYKVHISETCDPDDGRPNVITNVASSAATVPDQAMTAPIHQRLAERSLLPAEHYVDSGYLSAALLGCSRRDFGIRLIGPLMTNNSAQARGKAGYDLTNFILDYDARQATCPTGRTSVGWYPARNRGQETINVKFAGDDCRACPPRQPVHDNPCHRPLRPPTRHPSSRHPPNPDRGPRRTSHPCLAQQILVTRRRGRQHPPGRRRHPYPLRPLPRHHQDPPGTRLLGRSDQPDSARRALVRPNTRSQPHQPTRTTRLHPGRMNSPTGSSPAAKLLTGRIAGL